MVECLWVKQQQLSCTAVQLDTRSGWWAAAHNGISNACCSIISTSFTLLPLLTGAFFVLLPVAGCWHPTTPPSGQPCARLVRQQQHLQVPPRHSAGSTDSSSNPCSNGRRSRLSASTPQHCHPCHPAQQLRQASQGSSMAVVLMQGSTAPTTTMCQMCQGRSLLGSQ